MTILFYFLKQGNKNISFQVGCFISSSGKTPAVSKFKELVCQFTHVFPQPRLVPSLLLQKQTLQAPNIWKGLCELPTYSWVYFSGDDPKRARFFEGQAQTNGQLKQPRHLLVCTNPEVWRCQAAWLKAWITGMILSCFVGQVGQVIEPSIAAWVVDTTWENPFANEPIPCPAKN